MKKLSRSLALAGMMAVAASALSVAEAQEPKAKKATKKVGTVRVKQSEKTDKFYFSVYDGDGKYMGGGPASGFETKDDVAKGVEALKAALDGAKMDYIKGADDKDDKDEPKKDAKKKKADKDDDKDEPKKKDAKKKDKDEDKDEPKKDKKKGG